MEITIPYKFEPRHYQISIFKAIDAGFLRIIQIWHRRAGKEKTDINIMARELFQTVGAYYYIFPKYKQGRKVLWNGADKSGMRFMDHLPQETRLRTKDDEMFIEFKNGSTFQIVGSDNIDTIVGANPRGLVFSEYSLQDPKAWDYMRPILAENGGWAIFNFTPRGENHAKDLLEYAKTDPKNWYVSLLNVDETRAISEEILAQERNEILAKNGDDSIFLQEYYNSFSAGMQGSYYGKLIERMEKEEKMVEGLYDSELPVYTWWDLGVNDSMSIGFFQKFKKEWRFIDYFEGSGEGLLYYVKKLNKKPYIYAKHFAPHDIFVKEMGTGKTRFETAKALGLKFEFKEKEDGTLKSAVPKLSIEEGIDSVRRKLPTVFIDKTKCARAIKALRNYQHEFDDKNKVFRSSPLHDWASHCSDMFRYFCVTPEDVFDAENEDYSQWESFQQSGMRDKRGFIV